MRPRGQSGQGRLNYWDPTGLTGSSTLTGNWDDNNWATNAAGQAVPGLFQEGILAVFSSGTNGAVSTTVTVNSSHTLAGIFNGGIGGTTASTNLVINGPGTLSITSGYQGFSTSVAANNTTITTTLGGTGGVQSEGGGSLFLYGTNTYSGGTLLGTTAGLNFNNSNSFGMGINWGPPRDCARHPRQQ